MRILILLLLCWGLSAADVVVLDSIRTEGSYPIQVITWQDVGTGKQYLIFRNPNGIAVLERGAVLAATGVPEIPTELRDPLYEYSTTTPGGLEHAKLSGWETVMSAGNVMVVRRLKGWKPQAEAQR